MTHDQPPVDIRQYRPDIHPQLAKAIHSCIEPDVTPPLPLDGGVPADDPAAAG